MTAFDRAEEIAAWLGNLHPHQGPDETCAIRDRIMSAIHEEKRTKGEAMTVQCPKCGRGAERIQNVALAICRACDGVLRIEDSKVLWAGVRPSEIDPYARTLGILLERSYTGLVGSREERLDWIRRMTNEELLRCYTLSCRSGEIEVRLAGENDFNQHVLKAELDSRLRAIGFLPVHGSGQM